MAMSNITFPIENPDDNGLAGAGEPDFHPFDIPKLPDMPKAPLRGVTTTIFLITYASLIIASNLTVIVAYAIEKRLRTYNNFFIINLILTDMIVGFSLIVLFVSNCHPEVFWCKVYIGVNDGFLSVSVIIIVVICIDRHYATYEPIKHFTTRSATKAFLLNVIPWVVAFTFWLPFAFYGYDAMVPTEGDRPIGILLLSFLSPVLMTLVPLLIITVLYARILYKIRYSLGAGHLEDRFPKKPGGSSSEAEGRQSSLRTTQESGLNLKNLNSTSQDGSKTDMKSKNMQQTDQKEKRKPENRETDASARKATRSLSFIIISFLVSWMPHIIFVIVTSLDQSILFERKLPDVVLAFLSTIRYTNSFLNPVSYAAAQPLFRRTVTAMICKPRQYC